VLGPLLPVKGKLNPSAYQDVLDNVLPTLWEQLYLTVPQSKVHKDLKVGWASRTLLSYTEPDLNPILQLWDELGLRPH